VIESQISAQDRKAIVGASDRLIRPEHFSGRDPDGLNPVTLSQKKNILRISRMENEKVGGKVLTPEQILTVFVKEMVSDGRFVCLPDQQITVEDHQLMSIGDSFELNSTNRLQWRRKIPRVRMERGSTVIVARGEVITGILTQKGQKAKADHRDAAEHCSWKSSDTMSEIRSLNWHCMRI
jgi:hypothetical protein